ncbi:MAG: DNA-binding protein [Spirochaetaceae bacterium]|nr:DNA-binding protein [Spirochaetaceae bacterium]MBQ3024848.1 DNA-binding protein [Spirochaetaceae bacterium]MBQ7905267.1 DNA-binding protein [Spirochaetaceae bacterium]
MQYSVKTIKLKKEKKNDEGKTIIDEKGNVVFEEYFKYYARANQTGMIDILKIAKDISSFCTLTTTDIVAVLQSFIERIPAYLMDSKSVNLKPFGIFKLALNSESQEKEEDVTAKTIKGVRVLFKPSVELKKIFNDVTFSKK